MKFQAGCVKEAFSRWADLTSDKEVLETVQGMHINVGMELPTSQKFQYRFSTEENEFVKQELQALLAKGVIVETNSESGEFISPIFVRPKSDGGFRLILNLKSLNKTIEYKKFKMDTISNILLMIRPNMFMAKLDIKDAYYSIPINKSHQKLLKFCFDNILYKFTALPNGYTEGPRKFTKVLKPPLAFLRIEFELLIASYIDDLITMNLTFEGCMNNISKTVQVLTSLGFVIHPTKSKFLPSKTIEYLGFIIDSEKMIVSLTMPKKDSIFLLCNEILGSKYISIRTVAKLLGKFSSSFIGVKMGKLHYRALERIKIKALKINKGKFDKPMTINMAARNDILWWKNNIVDSFSPIIKENPTVTLYTDASSFGWGAKCGIEKCGGQFSPQECKFHINTLELKAALFGLQSLCKNVRQAHILVLIDNTSAVASINKMGSLASIDMDDVVHSIWNWTLNNKNWLTASHIPGVLNTDADKESREQESRTEWMLNKSDFEYLVKRLDFTPSIDLFASRLNKQLPVFVSFRADPESVAVNAFTLDWQGKKFYAFPPFNCIAKVLQKVWKDKAFGILVVPDWPNQIWYCQYKNMIINEIILAPRFNLLTLPSSSQHHPLHKTLRLRVALLSGIH